MKKCELCMSTARIFCESDKASLCWDCDAKVHSSNFLVTKHARSLLCQSCQSITPWTASGSKFSPTLSLCQSCAHKNSNNINHHDRVKDGHDHDDHDYDDDDDDDDEDEDEEEDEDEDSYDGDHEDDGENQVVPVIPKHQGSLSYAYQQISSPTL